MHYNTIYMHYNTISTLPCCAVQFAFADQDRNLSHSIGIVSVAMLAHSVAEFHSVRAFAMNAAVILCTAQGFTCCILYTATIALLLHAYIAHVLLLYHNYCRFGSEPGD